MDASFLASLLPAALMVIGVSAGLRFYVWLAR